MPQPSTVVTLHDEDGDEFPVRLPGVYRENRAADMEAAFQIALENVASGDWTPRGKLSVHHISYLNEVAS